MLTYKLPCPVSRTEIALQAVDLEPILRGPDSPALLKNPWKPKVVTLKDKSELIIREAKREEAPEVLKIMKPYFDIETDFYDVVTARTYAEILAWYRHRVKDHYLLVGIRDGELVGLANARLYSDKIAYSLHTMSFGRGAGVGPAMYFAKVEHGFENIGIDEWWVTFEGFIGLTVFGFRWAVNQKPWPEVQHELNGARVFYLTRPDWEWAKKRLPYYIGKTPVPEAKLRQAEKFKAPPVTVEET